MEATQVLTGSNIPILLQRATRFTLQVLRNGQVGANI